MTTYFRPIPILDAARPDDALPLAGGWAWFDRVEVLTREGNSGTIAATELSQDAAQTLSAPRPPVARLELNRPRLMGIVNVTPDSFSDGGKFLNPSTAIAHGRRLIDEGADLLDVGGEFTRPGADDVTAADETARVAGVIKALARGQVPVSADTRKAMVAGAALGAGAAMLNDVSALTFDPGMAATAAASGKPICLMHAQGLPKAMQDAPHYDDVLFDVYDHLAARRDAALAAGIGRDNIVLDPGIGFGKTLEHNLRLLRNLSLFHGLGCPILLGASRKRFIGTLSGEPDAQARGPGSVAIAMAAVAQGVQILRVHDMKTTKQALIIQGAVTGRGLW